METNYIYIITNKTKTVLYIGVTSNLPFRLQQHFDSKGNKKSFAGRYNCYILIYYEAFVSIKEAIRREKQLKRLSRKDKEALINSFNPNWNNLGWDFRY